MLRAGLRQLRCRRAGRGPAARRAGRLSRTLKNGQPLPDIVAVEAERKVRQVPGRGGGLDSLRVSSVKSTASRGARGQGGDHLVAVARPRRPSILVDGERLRPRTANAGTLKAGRKQLGGGPALGQQLAPVSGGLEATGARGRSRSPASPSHWPSRSRRSPRRPGQCSEPPGRRPSGRGHGVWMMASMSRSRTASRRAFHSITNHACECRVVQRLFAEGRGPRPASILDSRAR